MSNTPVVDLSTLPKVERSVNLFPESSPYAFRYRFNFRSENGFKVGLYTLPFKQAVTFRAVEKEKLFYDHCLPCQLYHDGSCPGGSRLMSNSSLRIGNQNYPSSTISCFKKVKVEEVDKSIIVSHPSLFISGHAYENHFNYKHVFEFRPDPDADLEKEDTSFESLIQLLPYLLANVHNGDARLCLGERPYEDIIYRDYPRTFTQHYDWGRVNRDLQPSVPGSLSDASIQEWVTDYNQKFKNMLVEDTDHYSTFKWESFTSFFNDNSSFDDFRVHADRSTYTHYVQYSTRYNSTNVKIIFFYNQKDTSLPVLRIRYSPDLSLFDRCLKPYDQVIEELS